MLDINDVDKDLLKEIDKNNTKLNEKCENEKQIENIHFNQNHKEFDEINATDLTGFLIKRLSKYFLCFITVFILVLLGSVLFEPSACSTYIFIQRQKHNIVPSVICAFVAAAIYISIDLKRFKQIINDNETKD